MPVTGRSARILLASLPAAVLLYVAWQSRLLRPIADDYVHGVQSATGFIDALSYWWMSWSGAMTTTAIMTLLMGIPLASMPLSVASAVPFLVGTVIVGASALNLLRASDEKTAKKQTVPTLLKFPAVAVAYFGWWWLPVLFNQEDENALSLALATTHWQTVVTGYVIPIALLVWAWVRLEDAADGTSRQLIMVYLIFGTLVGFSGPVNAVSAVATIAVASTATALAGRSMRARRVRWAVFSVGAIAAASASHLSPGSQNRSTYLLPPDIDVYLVYYIVTDAIPRGFSDWFSAVFSLRSLLVFVLIAGVAALVDAPKVVRDGNLLSSLRLDVILLSLVSFIIMRISQYFSYEAFWHSVGPLTVLWLAVTTTALDTGRQVARTEASRLRASVPSLIVATAVSICLVVASILPMTVGIERRFSEWVVGPAPLPGIADIEESGGWVDTAWLKLQAARGFPARDYRQIDP